MHEVNLTPEQARERLQYIYLRIWQEQYNVNFFIRDVRSDVYLKNEIRAYLEGRINEISGWTDILGQLRDWFINNILNPITSGINSIQGWWSTIQSIWNNVSNFFSSITSWVTSFVSNPQGIIMGWVNDVVSRITGVSNFQLYNLFPQVTQTNSTASNIFGDITNDVKPGITNIFTSLANLGNLIGTSIWPTLQNANSNVLNIPGSVKTLFDGAVVNIIGGLLNPLQQFARWSIENSFTFAQLGIGQFSPSNIYALLSYANPFQTWVLNESNAFINEIIATASSPLPTEKDALQREISNRMSRLMSIAVRIETDDFVAKMLAPKGTPLTGHSPIPPAVVGAVEALVGGVASQMANAALGNPIVQAFNRWLRPTIPGVADLQRMYAAGLISRDAFVEGMQKHGFWDGGISAYEELRFTLPAVSDLNMMIYRGLIPEEEYRKNLKLTGFSDTIIEAYRSLRERIPGPGDLVSFVVREAFPLERLPEAPSDFEKYMKMQGYSELWSRAYWWSHWKLPAFEQLREAYWRGIISLQEFQQFMIWHDYAPFARPGISRSDLAIMSELQYQLPGRIEQRWMMRWGLLSRDELKSLTIQMGIHPNWVDKVVDAEIRNMLTDERSRLLTQLRGLYMFGKIREEELRSMLAELHYSKDEIDLITKAANYERERAMLEKRIDTAVLEYRYSKISKEQLTKALSELGLNDEHVQNIVAYESARTRPSVQSTPEEEARGFGKEVAISRYVEGATTKVELEQELRLLGYRDEEIKKFVVYADLKKDLNMFKDVVSAVNTAFSRRKISETKYIEILRSFGVPDETIRALISLQRIKLGIGMAEEAA